MMSGTQTFVCILLGEVVAALCLFSWLGGTRFSRAYVKKLIKEHEHFEEGQS